MNEQVAIQAAEAIRELCDRANLQAGSILVVGCSTSEVRGSKMGTDSSPDTGEALFQAIQAELSSRGVYLAAQCCEHLNRCIVLERAALPGAETVNVIPQPKAGGSFATAAYRHFNDPVVLEEIRADAGIDIGGTLIGMHLKRVAVPLRLDHCRVGEALVSAARVRPKFVGGVRACYNEAML